MKCVGIIEVRHGGLLIMERLGFSLELRHVFPRAATRGFFVRRLKFTGFFSATEEVEHLLAVWAGEGCPEALNMAVNHSSYLVRHTDGSPLPKELVISLVTTVRYERGKSAAKEDNFLEGTM